MVIRTLVVKSLKVRSFIVGVSLPKAIFRRQGAELGGNFVPFNVKDEVEVMSNTDGILA